ncbi:MAG: hypothetical protein P1P65_03710 [Treponema sp.]
MDVLKKNLIDRKKERDTLQASLHSVYTECGAAQFEYALHNTDYVRHIAQEDFEFWKTLRNSRIQDADTILNIKTAHSRQNELKTFCKEVDALLQEQKVQYEKIRNKFALLFFETYAGHSLSCLSPVVQDVLPLKESIGALMQEQHTLEEQKNAANFLKKIALTSQLTVLKSKINGVQKKIDDRIIREAGIIVSDSCLAQVRSGNVFPEPLEQLYTELQDLTDKQNETESRKETLNAEQEKQTELLKEWGVTDTVQKRISALNHQIKQTDEEILSAENRQGLVYTDVFYLPDGTARNGVSADNEPEMFTPYLNAAADYRRQLEKNAFNIEYIENELTLASEMRKITALEKAISGYRDGILQYEQLIAAAEQNIAAAETIKAGLEEKNRELLPKFS